MAIISDSFGEAIRKSVVEITPTEYKLRTFEADGLLSGVSYDYVSLTISPSDTETYTFKTGGASGTTAATITIVYTDASRETLSSVTRT